MSRPSTNRSKFEEKSGVEDKDLRKSKSSPMKLECEQLKDKEFCDFIFRPEPDEKISRKRKQKADLPVVKENKPVNSIKQDKPNKTSSLENSVDDDNDGWITVKSNRSPKINLKKNIEENLQDRLMLNHKLSRPNYNKFSSHESAGSYERNINASLNVKSKTTTHKGATFGKKIKELWHDCLLENERYDDDRHFLQNRARPKPIVKGEVNSVNSIDRPQDLPVENLEILKESEEKIQAKLLKKIRIKEHRKRKREDKARIIRDNLRKDTKVNVISQEIIDMFSKSAVHESVSNNYKKYVAPYCEEYPIIGGSVNRGSRQQFSSNDKINHHQRSESKTKSIQNKRNYSRDEFIKSPTSYHSAIRDSNGPSSCDTDFVDKNKLVDRSVPKSVLNSSHIEEDPLEVKKSVKSKDRMNLAIMSLLEMKQKEKKKDGKTKVNSEQKPVKPVIERHGKIRENSKKKLSVLKKNMIREKKRREELLLSLLKYKSADATEVSVCEKTLPVTVEPNSETSISISSVNIGPDADMSASSPFIEKCCESSMSSEVLSMSLSNSNGKVSHKGFLDQPFQKIENSAIIKEINILMNPVHSKKFREYCDQIVTLEINTVLTELIQLLVKFQDRLYQLDPLKARIKRRFYCGLKESMKHMNRLVCIIMAPNLKPSPGPGCVDELVMKLLNKAAECGIPIVFGLTNRLIGRLCHKKVPVSCFSIVNYQGAQDNFHALMDLVPAAKREYQELLESRGLTSCGQDDFEGDASSSKENVTSSEVACSFLQSLKAEEKVV